MPLCGNSIGTDRRFLAAYLPEIEEHLHYRSVDVSTIKELTRRWYPGALDAVPRKATAHRALDDIRESIQELRWYREQRVPPVARRLASTDRRRRDRRTRPHADRRAAPPAGAGAGRHRDHRGGAGHPAARSCPISLPGLGHVNCYLLEDERGVAIVDPGLPGPQSWRALVDRLKQAGYKPQATCTPSIVTHSHPDHFGGAGRLRDAYGAEVISHRSFRTLVRPGGGRGPPRRRRARPRRQRDLRVSPGAARCRGATTPRSGRR